MLEFLKTVFGKEITLTEYAYPDKTPFYIRDGYTAQRLSFHQNDCVLLTPKSTEWRLPTVKKQLMNFQKSSNIPCALALDNLTSLQRQNLIENNIPFVSSSKQVYLPFWGSCFTEHFKSCIDVTDKMAPGTQLVFLYLYYLQKNEELNLTQIAEELKLSKATCTRAIDDLSGSGLITIRAEGTHKWISVPMEKNEYLKAGYSRLRTPVDRRIYVSRQIPALRSVFSGVLALSDLTMVCANEQDGAFAISKKSTENIPADLVQSEQEFFDFGGYVLEVWCYDPFILSDNGRVDDISLLLSLDNSTDERIQMGLNEIRIKHELPTADSRE